MKFIESFLSYIEFEKRYSANTIESYRLDLRQFYEFVDEVFNEKSLFNIEHNHVRSWVIDLMEQQRSRTTINRKISSLKAFFKFLMKREGLKINPTVRVQPLKKEAKLPEFVETKSINEVLDNVIVDSGYKGVLELTILELFYGTGMRLSELIQLKESDVSLQKQEIKVLGKGNKERFIPLNNSLIAVLKKYIFEKNSEFGNIKEFLLVTTTGKGLNKSFVYRTVRKYLGLVKNQNKKSPHVLRHTFATHLLDQGADLNAIKDLMGHASLASTQVYTHNTLDKLKKVFEQAHPKA